MTKGYRGRPKSVYDTGFELNGNEVKLQRSFDSYMLSTSDIECLTEAVQVYGHMTFGELKNISHDEAYNTAFKKRGTSKSVSMPLSSIAKMVDDSGDLVEHLGLGG